LDVFDEKPLPYNLDVTIQFPYTILSLGPLEQARYGEGRITPVWANGAFGVFRSTSKLRRNRASFRRELGDYAFVSISRSGSASSFSSKKQLSKAKSINSSVSSKGRFSK